MSPGRKNNFALQRSSQEHNVKVSDLGLLIGKFITLLHPIPCFYRMCIHLHLFILTSKHVKRVTV